jgi:hypothetical protein
MNNSDKIIIYSIIVLVILSILYFYGYLPTPPTQTINSNVTYNDTTYIPIVYVPMTP